MLLEVRQLQVHYGGIRAVAGVDLEVEEGELVCLIGANGAGKTSTLKAICGLIGSKSGAIHYGGEDISRAAVHELPRKGLVMVPEGRGIFAQLTVEENLAMGLMRTAAEIPARNTSASHGSPSAASKSPARSRAVSSRCSPLRGR